jgi:hypothetical protein
MPRPRPVPVNVNEFTRAALKAIEPQFHAAGRPPVTPEVHLGEPDPAIEADPDQLRAALENLLLHCLDAMPAGGTLAIRTKEKDSVARIEVSVRGASFSAEDCQRLFAPAGSAPEGMTGLGLATAQAVVSEHGGRITAELAADSVATLRLEFPAVRSGVARPSRVEIKPPAPPPAAIPPQPEPEPPAPAAAAEPVQVTVVATEAATTSGEASPAPETSSQPDKPNDPARAARRGLLFTE